jgi:hypothetical protein
MTATRSSAQGEPATVPTDRWHRDPAGFLDQRLGERGLTVQQFLAARPGQSWNQLVHAFDEPLAPIQLMAYVQQAAAKGHWLDWYARDSLVRTLGEHLPDGWRRQGAMDSRTAHALADWLTIISILGPACAERAHQVVDWLKRAQLPLGWLPDGPDDPLLVAAFGGVRFHGCR